MKEKNKVYVGWQEFGDMSKQLAEMINQANYVFDGVYGIPRGGKPLAVYLSHILELDYLENPSQITAKTLIVDDRSHNGNSLEPYKNNLIACLYSTPGTKVRPKWCTRIAQPNDWIVFPWEPEDEPTEKNNK